MIIDPYFQFLAKYIRSGKQRGQKGGVLMHSFLLELPLHPKVPARY